MELELKMSKRKMQLDLLLEREITFKCDCNWSESIILNNDCINLNYCSNHGMLYDIYVMNQYDHS